MDNQGNAAHQALHYHNSQACNPIVEDICSTWAQKGPLSGPSQNISPDSVLSFLPDSSPPLDQDHSSSPPSFDYADQYSPLPFGKSYMCEHNIKDMAIGDADNSRQVFQYSSYVSPVYFPPHFSTNCPMEICTSLVEDNVPMVESSDDEASRSLLVASHDTNGTDGNDAIILDYSHAAQNLNGAHFDVSESKQHVVAASPCHVPAMLRQHVKKCLEATLLEELALCGCDLIVKKDGELICNPQDHHLECKMRGDVFRWVMWMQQRSIKKEGLHLVHRLLACAEAVACRDVHQAQALLQSVEELASPYGDSPQRVAFCFKQGLAARLSQQCNVTGSTPANQSVENAGIKLMNQPRMFAHDSAFEEVLGRQQEAFRFLCDVCPYVPFGHFVANSVIMEAVEGEEMVHVINLGMTDGSQWVALMLSLATRPGGTPKLLRITGISDFASKLEEVGKLLHQEATAVLLNFEFKAVHQSFEHIAAAELDLRDGEIVVVNSVLRLHCVVKESRGSLKTVLHAIHGFSPRVLTLVEQDASHNGPFFLGRFMEALHYYSAIFDSLQAALPRNSTRRVNIEQCLLAHEISNIVACEGQARVERHERVDQWRRRMSRAGFQLASIRLEKQARVWLNTNYAAHVDDYTLSEDKGCLLLGWKGRPIIAASAWKC